MPRPEIPCINHPMSAGIGKDTLCHACIIELTFQMIASKPDSVSLRCRVCQAPYRYTEARVMRAAINPASERSPTTPKLCWVCARLHISAHEAP
jgi:hypothetical protein